MNGVMSDEDKLYILDQALAGLPFTDLKMGLSEADITPTHATVLVDLTADEVGVAGYARQDVTGWGAAVLTGDFHARAEAALVTFVNTSGGDTGIIYCWFLVDVSNDVLVMAGRYDLPFVMPATTGSYTTTPFWQRTGE